MTLMATEQTAAEAVAFSQVEVGDKLTFLTADNGFGGSGRPVKRSGVVTSKTDKTVVLRTEGSLLSRSMTSAPTARLRRADWASRNVHRIP